MSFCNWTGDQPEGEMSVSTSYQDCVGFERKGRIEITYNFRSGYQGV